MKDPQSFYAIERYFGDIQPDDYLQVDSELRIDWGPSTEMTLFNSISDALEWKRKAHLMNPLDSLHLIKIDLLNSTR